MDSAKAKSGGLAIFLGMKPKKGDGAPKEAEERDEEEEASLEKMRSFIDAVKSEDAEGALEAWRGLCEIEDEEDEEEEEEREEDDEEEEP